MPLQNGLRPIDDEIAAAPTMNALSGRVQVQDPIRSPGLTPVAQPTDTFIRAAQPQQPTAAMRLADSLSSLAPALMQYGQAQQAVERSDMPGKVSAALTGRTAAEQKQILATNPDLQSHMAQNLGNQMLGSATAEDTINRLRTEYTTGGFNRDSGNFDQWVNTAIQADLKSNTDPHFAETYRQRVLAGVENLRGAQLQYGSQRTVQAQNDLIYGNVKAALGKAVDQGWSADKLSAAVQQSFATTDTVAHKSPEEQRAILVTMLGRTAADLSTDPQYAQKYALLKGMLSAPQPGQDGKPGASLLDSTTLGGQAADVLRSARTAFDARQMGENSSAIAAIHDKATNADPSYKADLQAMQKAHPEWMTAGHAVTMDQTFDHAVKVKAAQQQKADLEQNYQVQKDKLIATAAIPLLQQGDGHSLADATITGKDGKPEVYSGADQLKDGVAAADQMIERRYAGQDTPAAQDAKFATKARLYSTNGVTNDDWKTLITSAPAAATTMVQAGGAPPPTLAKGLDTYQRLKAIGGPALAAHTDERSRDFFENVLTLKQDMGYDDKQAFSTAAAAVSDPNWNKADPGITKRDKATAISNALSLGIFHRPGFLGGAPSLNDVDNASQPAVEVSEAAEALHRGTGLPWDKAIAKAAERVSQNYTVINGSAVRIADSNVPANFTDMANTYLNDWYTAHKADLDKQGLGKSDLTMQALGKTTNWVILAKGHPTSLQLPGAAFSLQILAQRDRQARSDAADKANAAAEEQARERQANTKLLTEQPLDASPFWNSP